MKDIKALLKQCRDAIKAKDYDTALRLSKSVLKEDKTNYMALVFLGLSLQEVGPSEEAPKAFNKAIQLNSKNPLAYTGLINYYEKIDSIEATKNLNQLYSTAIDLELSDTKIIEYCEKLANICDGDLAKVAQKIFRCSKSENMANSTGIFTILVKLFEKTKNLPIELLEMYEFCLLYLIKQEETCNRDYYSLYLSVLYKQEKYEDVLVNAEKMYNLFAPDTTSLVWICKTFNLLYMEFPQIAEKNFDKARESSTKLLQVEPKNSDGLFSKSIILLRQNDLLEAKSVLIEVVSLRPRLLHAWVLLTKFYIKSNLYDEAIEAYLTADKLMQAINYSNKILKDILVTLSLDILSMSSNEDDWKKATELYENLEGTVRHNCLEFVIRASINLGKFDKSKLLIADLKRHDEPASRFLLAKLYHKQGKYQEALDLLENSPTDDSDCWMEIGLLYWNLENYPKCLNPFLKAAKSNPNNFLCFQYLGDYYKIIEDYDKARRCYEKAYKLNPKSRQIGTELSKTYRKLQNWEATQNLLHNLTTDSINKKNSWAWLQLGLSFLEQENYPQAIDNLRFVTRIEPDNIHCWQSLADAYFARGSYTSALKCYQKSLDLSKSSLYPSLQIANIKKILADYSEAKSDFEEILFENGQYVPALKGLAETYMCLARECLRDQRIGTARDHAQTALEKLIFAMEQRSEFSCLWKLMADSCLFVARLPEKYCCLIIPKTVLEGKEEEGKAIAEREEIYNTAIRCYCKAISLVEDNALIWHDLGTCYLHHALNTEHADNVEQLFTYAMAAARHCTAVNGSNWQHWNLLGNVAMSQKLPNYALAQHAYIQAVTANHNSAMSWCNLGVLYLLKDDIKLANEAFAQGQRSDPDYVNSWIGQAMIAESMGHEEAMDLFRHSTQLSQHQQGGLGYAHWVCKTLLEAAPDENIYSIHNMNAIPVACDALTWYTEKNPYDGCSWNMLGILRERMGLREGTAQAFKKAFKLSRKEYRDLARVNYGRILTKQGRYSEAIDMFQAVQEATFNSGSGLALALFKDKQYEESYSAYEQALHWLTAEQSTQSDLLVALSSMVYMLQGPDAAKTLLFQSIELKPPSPWSLYAILSLGLLHKDLKLSKLVLNELVMFKDKQEYLKHYSLLLSYVYLIQGQHDRAIKEVSKLIHRHPGNPSVWLTLCSLLLRLEGDQKYSSTAANCALVAKRIGQNMDVAMILSLVPLASSLAGNQKCALIAAQKAVHCFPANAECWAVLTSILSYENISNATILVPAMLRYIRGLSVSTALSSWLREQESA